MKNYALLAFCVINVSFAAQNHTPEMELKKGSAPLITTDPSEPNRMMGMHTRTLLRNQDTIIENQHSILANQKEILANQEKILAKLDR